jgi:calcineurin-like phosphoesterase family protein
MSTSFLASDTHLGHAKILTFTRDDGTPLRAFSSVEEMDEHMIDRWNAVVRPQDRVYHLGDVAMRWSGVELVRRLNGHKRLIMGNHDIFDVSDYLQKGLFEKVFGVKVLEGLVMTHIPLHPGCVKQQWTNVHGHLHNNHDAMHLGVKYLNVSVEMIGYTPVSLEEIRDEIAYRQLTGCSSVRFEGGY